VDGEAEPGAAGLAGAGAYVRRRGARVARRRGTAACVALALLAWSGGIVVAAAAPAVAAPVTRDPDTGDFVARYVLPETPDYAIYHDQLRAQRFLEAVAQELNRALRLPADVTLRLAECGHSTTEWDRDTRTVTVCYEFLEAVIAIAGEGETPEHAEQLFSGAVTFALFAEVGRGLVGLYDLPIDGTPLEAGDEFATVSLAAAERDGDRAAASAVQFLEHALRTPESGFEWLETHAFDRTRLERVACLLYGNAPRNHAASVESGLVPKERAPRCAEDLLQVAQAWDRRLREHTQP
jgi:hypothetical protein